MSVDTDALMAVLTDTHAILTRQGNDFSWSSFPDADAALQEVEELSAAVRAGDPPLLMLTILFAPTGPIQEVSLSSGWAEEFLVLADRFDAAIANAALP
ncbi:hypothetical protein [Micromonospora echinofusca]|uniref:Uncharacterized protein n=1 Tax=Micromonospora echinofusca TaxID=47858 RepID=A0ABS3VP31_MICEH|nr:hypothetical protein [Micromonospora echinofusca]MBO4206163.1 hypothetical protein [Micromonospora echinofusca]